MTDVLADAMVPAATFLSEFWPYAAFFIGFALVARIARIRVPKGQYGPDSGRSRSTSFSGSSWGDRGAGALRAYERDMRGTKYHRDRIAAAFEEEGGDDK